MKITNYQIKSVIIHLAFFLMATLSLLVSKGVSIAPALILLVSFSAFLDKKKSSITRDDYLIISVLLLYFTAGLADTLLRKQSISNLDLFLRYAIAAWFVFYLSRFKLHSSMLWLGYAIGAVATGSFAIYAKFHLNMPRVETSGLNSIHFGNLSMLLAASCFAGVFWAGTLKYRRLSIAFMFFAGVMAVIASMLSGTRSGWVGLPLMLIAFYSFFSDHFQKKYVLSGSLLVVIFITALVFTPQTHVLERIDEAVYGIQQYSQGYSDSSAGIRFEMWRSGYYAFLEKPVFGWGETAFYVYQHEVVDTYSLNDKILNFNHLHNQYIEELAKRGIIGFIALLLLFAIPAKLFLRRIRAENDHVRALAAAGLVSVIFMAEFCFTQAMLRINSGVMFFVFNIVFIWSAMRSVEQNQINAVEAKPL